MKKKVELKFVKLLSLKECDAQAIFIAVTNFFSQNKVATEKFIMFTSDGASVMLGRNNGVQAKLKAIVPHLLEFHRVAHREALAVSHAYNSIDNFAQLESTLQAIYSYFSHPSTHLERLKSVFNVLDKKFVRLQKLFDIRWLSRLQAIVKSYKALILYFDDQANENVTAEGIVKRLKKYRFVVCLHFLCDILSTLGQLNKTFQLPTYHPCDAHRKITEVSKALKSRYLEQEIRWGPFASDCIQAIKNGEIVVQERELTKQDEERKRLKKDMAKFVEKFLENLKARFPNSELFDPKAVPVSDADCAAHGEKELRLLTTHYSTFVDHNLCLLEWDTLKQCMKISYSGYSFRDFILKLATDDSFIAHYPSLAKLAEIILLYPSSTAEVERGFSFQNATKTKFHNRLSPNHLDQLLRLRLNAPRPQNSLFISHIEIGSKLSTVIMWYHSQISKNWTLKIQTLSL